MRRAKFSGILRNRFPNPSPKKKKKKKKKKEENLPKSGFYRLEEPQSENQESEKRDKYLDIARELKKKN